MEQSHPHYAISVEARLPEFETERLFVINEKEHAHGQVVKLRQRKSGLLAGLARDPKLKDWKHYIQALDHYATKIDQHEEEIAEGLVPVKFFVVNMGDKADEAIKIRVKVENGTIHPAKQAPERPERVDDGPAHIDLKEYTPPPQLKQVVGLGFRRSEVKITAHAVEAEFSQLEAQDSADLVHQVLYVAGNKDTKFSYEITSKHLPEVQRGEVEFD
jgi:hypothetical protein